ncbi:MAG: alpha-L-glutamate ligase [Polyangiaceae bacterium]|nr:alpha-L-glutamate ligase [Polyangiaceae bacterium]
MAPLARPKPIAVYYEHPDWFRPLFAGLERRGSPAVHLDAACHRYDPSERELPYALVVNRASPSAYLRGKGQTTFHTLAWLRHLARLGVPVVNGAEAYAFEISKAAQLDLFEELGLPYPASRVINHASQAPAAAEGLRFPVLVKANVGGSGAGIARYETPAALAEAARAGSIDLGVDGSALVQEAAPLRGGGIVRVELLDGQPLYAIRVYPEAGSFNLCPADACIGAEGATLERAACPRASCVAPRSTSAGSNTSSTIATAGPTSTTSTPSRTSSPTPRASSASTPSSGSATTCSPAPRRAPAPGGAEPCASATGSPSSAAGCATSPTRAWSPRSPTRAASPAAARRSATT